MGVMNINVSDSVTVTERLPIIFQDDFMTRLNGKFMHKGKRKRGFWMNLYDLWGRNQASLQAHFTEFKKKNIDAVRFWGYDLSVDGPFHYLEYPLGPNLIDNPSVETDLSGWVSRFGGALNGSVFTRVNTDSYDGSWCIKQVSSSGTADFLTRQVTVSPNTTYVWTFWYKTTWTPTSGGQLPVVCWVGNATNSVSGREIADFGQLAGATVWTKKRVIFNSGSNTQVSLNLVNFFGQNVSYFDNFNLSIPTAATLLSNEAAYQQMDLVVDEARKAGIKLIMSFMDSNESNYNSKRIYANWINAMIPGKNIPIGDTAGIYNTPAFFTDTDMQNLYESHLREMITRTNTISGLNYNSDPTLWWELGNEIRYNQGDFISEFSPNMNILSNPGGWADKRSTFIKSIAPYQLVGFGGATHDWHYATSAGAEDWIANGTYTGVGYEAIIKLPNIDYIDPHLYPLENSADIHNYGFRWGFTVATRGLGMDEQIKQWILAAKAVGKPMILGETGIAREQIGPNTYYPLYPRVDYFTRLAQTVFDNDGDAIVIWSAGIVDAGSFTTNITGTWNGDTTNLNFDDRPVAALIGSKNANFNALVPESIGIDKQFGWIKGIKIR